MKKIKIPNVESDEVLVIKVGTDDRPASEENIKDVAKSIKVLQKTAKKDKFQCLVTHHAIEFSLLKRSNLKNFIVCSDIEKIK